MRTAARVAVLSLAWSVFLPVAQAQQRVPVRILSHPVEFASVWDVVSGPVRWVEGRQGAPAAQPAGVRYRLVLTIAEIYSVLYVDRIEVGPEGCCAEITQTRQLMLRDVFSANGVPGEITGIELLEPGGPGAFRFRFKGSTYELGSLDDLEPTLIRVDP